MDSSLKYFSFLLLFFREGQRHRARRDQILGERRGNSPGGQMSRFGVGGTKQQCYIKTLTATTNLMLCCLDHNKGHFLHSEKREGERGRETNLERISP